MKPNFKKEVGRKFIHLFAVLYVVFYLVVFNSFGRQVALSALLVLFVFFLAMDFFRLELGKKILIFWRVWREKEDHTMGGYVFFLLGVILALSFFDIKSTNYL